MTNLSNQLTNAILSMDAYNRGYDAGINIDGGNTSLNSTVGHYTIKNESDVDEGTPGVNIGFYALAYEYAGETIISYRGTNYPNSDNPFVRFADVLHGWPMGAGDINTEQGLMALKFYQEVVGTGNDPRSGDIRMVGHSLGGGLAGYVSGLYHKDALVFNTMPFVDAANNTVNFFSNLFDDVLDYRRQISDIASLLNDGITPNLNWGPIAIANEAYAMAQDVAFTLPNTTAEDPEFGRVSGYYITGEALDNTITTRNSDEATYVYTLNDPKDQLTKVDKHSMATVILRMFAEEDEVKDNIQHWVNAEQYLWPVLHDKAFAEQIGMNDAQRVSGQLLEQDKYADILRTTLAYSALESGVLPFGNTGIRSFYNDANDLGGALNVADNGHLIENIAEDISKYFIHFAGQLALNDVELSDQPESVNGLLTYDSNTADQLEINLSGDYWTEQIGNTNHNHVITKSGLLTSILANGSSYGTSVIPSGTIVDNVTIRLFGDTIKILEENEMYLGSEGKDIVIGSVGNDVILTNGGNDIIDAGQGANLIDTGAGDDTILRAGSGSIVTTGTGIDKLVILDNTYITDASFQDLIFNYGYQMRGGFRFAHSESPWVTNALGRYGKNFEGDLVVSDITGQRSMFIANYTNRLEGGAGNTAGIYIYEEDWDAYLIRNKKWDDPSVLDSMGVFGERWKVITGINNLTGLDPLILDLDDDGLELTTQNYVTGQYFDLQESGFAIRTGWVNADDGFLVRDLNSNGLIDNVGEMFGNVGVTGYSELAAIDRNSDGVVNANDAAFSDLRVWRDLDQDAETDTGELFTLGELGIEALNAAPDTTSNSNNNGHIIDSTGSFTRTDGTTGSVFDVLFDVNTFDSKFLGDVTISASAALLPEVKGHGTLPDLRVAMTLSPALETIVTNASANFNTPDLEALRVAVRPILDGWVASYDLRDGLAGTESRIDFPMLVSTSLDGGATVSDFGIRREDIDGFYWELASGAPVLDDNDDPIARPTYDDIIAQGSDDPNSSWTILTSNEIIFLERFFGISMPFGIDNNATPAAIQAMSDHLNDMWGELNKVIVKIATQAGPLQSFFEGVSYEVEDDKFVATDDRDLAPMLEAIFAAAPGNPSGDQAHLDSWKAITDIVVYNYERPFDLMVSYGFLFKNIVTAYENVGLTISIEDAAEQFDIPSEIILNGTGAVQGTSTDDIFYLNGDNETAIGSDGSDTYVIGRDFGTDVIQDFETSITGRDHLDIVRFAHYNIEDLTFERVGVDLVITVTNTSNVLTIEDQFVGRKSGGLQFGAFSEAKGVSEISFANGDVWDRFQISQNAMLTGDTNADTLIGGMGTDYIDGQGGADTLSGKEGNDVYIYEQGYGHVTIDEDVSRIADNIDIIQFGENIELSDLILTRDSFSNHLVITFQNAPDDSITILNQFNSLYNILSGLEFINRIEGFEFADGRQYSWQEMVKDIPLSYSTTGNDNIYGFEISDTLDGGAGDDNLYGGEGNDTYIFGRGYGFDTIEDKTSNLGLEIGLENKNIVQFLPDVLPEDVVVHRFLNDATESRSHIYMTIQDTGDTLKIQNSERQQTGKYYAIDEVHFDNGTIWSHQDLRDMAIAEASTSGDDIIVGFNSDDTINGGLGNDRLEGDRGSDTYLWSDQEGNDVIYDEQRYAVDESLDTVKFTNLNIGDVSFDYSGVGRGLVFTSLNNGATLTIENQERGSLGYEQVEFFEFQNGDVYTHQQIRQLYLDNLPDNTGATIVGFNNSDDTLEGGSGDDILRGLDGDDTYIYGLSSGNDVIQEDDNDIQRDNDTVIFQGLSYSDVSWEYDFSGTTNHPDLVFTVNATGNTLRINPQEGNRYAIDRVENFVFTDVTRTNLDFLNDHFAQEKTTENDTIIGFRQYDDTLDGGSGDDYLVGLGGNDTYIYGLNYGHDVVNDDSYYSSAWADTSQDKIKFIDGLEIDDFNIRIEDGDLIFEAKDFDGSLTVQNYAASSSEEALELYEFKGVDWTIGDIHQHIATADGYILKENDSSEAELRGTGYRDLLVGSASAETIYGGGQNDMLVGNAGDDRLEGQSGDDIYVYNLGDGNDVIYDRQLSNDSNSRNDKIQFGNSILPEDMVVSYGGSDNIVFTNIHTNETLTIIDQERSAYYYEIESVEFADGTVWESADLRTLSILTSSTSGSDVITGFRHDEEFNGGEGDDTIYARGGYDTAIYNGIYSNYSITASGNQTTVEDAIGSDGIDTIYDVEQLNFLNGYYTIADGLFTLTNTNPVANDDVFAGYEDAQIRGNVLSNDSDTDNDPLSVVATTITTANGGSVSIQSNGDFTYTPAIGYFGADSFDYTLEDGRGGLDKGTVNLTVNEVPDTNDPQAPTANRAYLIESVGSQSSIGNNSAINTGNYLQKTQAIAFETGADINSLQMLYEQGGGSRGLNLFIDGGKLYAAVWNYPEEGWGYHEIAADIEANSYYTASLVMAGALPANGSAILYLNGAEVGTVSGIGQLYSHSGDISIGSVGDQTVVHDSKVSSDLTFNGSIEKLVQYNEALTGTDITQLNDYLADGWVSTEPANTPPTAQDDAFTTDEDVVLSGNVLADNGNGADSDADGDGLTVIAGTYTTAQGGSVVLGTDGEFTYTPAAGYFGADSFAYSLEDGQGGSDTGTVSVTVHEVIDPPSSDAPENSVYLYEDGVSLTGLSNDAAINTGTYLGKTQAIAFETGADINSLQMLYEQGGGSRGLNLFIDGGKLYAAVWNYKEESWGYKEIAADIEANSHYTASLVMDGALPADGSATLYLNGAEVGTVQGVGKLYRHNGDISIGSVGDQTVVHNSKVSSDLAFSGTIEKLVQYNDALTGADITQLNDYLADGWVSTGSGNTDPTVQDDVVMEFGSVDASHNSVTVSLDNSFDNPVVFLTKTTMNEADVAVARVTDVTSESFTFYTQEPEYLDGVHALESYSYVVMEEGSWTLDDGTRLEVGTIDTNAMRSNGMETIGFTDTFEATPVVMSQVQTNNDADFVDTRQDSSTIEGFQLMLQEEELLNNGSHGTETVGWFAIEQGTGSSNGHDFYADITDDTIRHGFEDVLFNEIDELPQLLAQISTYDGRDSSFEAVRNLSASGAQIAIQEDQSADSEVRHTTERYDIFAIEGDGYLTATANDEFV